MKKLIASFYNSALRDAFLAGFVVLLVSGVTGLFVLQSASHALKTEVQQNLKTMAMSAANLVDADKHQQITQPEQKGSEIYEEVRKPFFSLLKANRNIAFIYTVIEKEGKIFFILDSKIMEPGAEDDTSDVMEQYDDATDVMKEAFATRQAQVEEESYTDDWGTFLSGYAPIVNSKNEFVGLVGADIRLTDYLEKQANIRKTLIIGAFIALIASIASGAGVWMMRRSAMRAQETSRRQQDEMARMDSQRLENDARQKTEAERSRKEALRQLASDFEQKVGSVITTVSTSADDMHDAAELMAQASVNTSVKAHTMSDSASAAARDVDGVLQATGELSGAIEEIRHQVTASSQITGTATQKAHATTDKVRKLVAAVERIGEIVTLISNIAGQTNMLALNATIEAARAGEAGRGFVVVANEVKSLAAQTAGATQDITRQIHSIQAATQETDQAIAEIIQVIGNMEQSSGAVAAAVTQQSALTGRIVESVRHATSGMATVTDNIAEVTQAANKTGDSSARVLGSAEELSRQASYLKDVVNNFIATVRG